MLLHALCDAILGCLGLGDIGEHFPDSDEKFDNISSAVLLSEVMDKARRMGLTVTHVDLTVIAQTPRLSPHKEGIRANVAASLVCSCAALGLPSVNRRRSGANK